MSELYLVHHGIKGQKWGVRRYQNPDGSLTEEGKKRAYRDSYESANPKLKGLSTADKRLATGSAIAGTVGAVGLGASIAGLILAGPTAAIPVAGYIVSAELVGGAMGAAIARIPINAVKNTMKKNRGIEDYKVDKSVKKQEKQAWKDYDRNAKMKDYSWH